MKFLTRAKPVPSEKALEALEEATAATEFADSRDPRVAMAASNLANLRERNHFADAMRRLFEGA